MDQKMKDTMLMGLKMMDMNGDGKISLEEAAKS